MASLKNFGIQGIARLVQFGKKGAQLDASDGSNVALRTNTGDLAHLNVAPAVNPQDAVPLSMLEFESKTNTIAANVSYDDTEVTVFVPGSKGATIIKTIVESTSAWTGADGATEITVGTDTNPTGIFSDFDVDVQNISDLDAQVAANVEVKAYVTPSTASSGTATVWVWYVDKQGLDGKFAATTEFFSTIDGGGANTSSFNETYDGGSA